MQGKPSNQSMKPTAPFARKTLRVCQSTPPVTYLFFVRRNRELHLMEKKAL